MRVAQAPLAETGHGREHKGHEEHEAHEDFVIFVFFVIFVTLPSAVAATQGGFDCYTEMEKAL